MNWLHRRLCASRAWQGHVVGDLLPWALAGVPLGGDVLEIGPGPGAATEHLLSRARRLTCVEIDRLFADRLSHRFSNHSNITVRCEDATQLSMPDGSFDSVLCLMMLHHVSPQARQDQLVAEARRVLRPGGRLIIVETRPSVFIHALHIGDTLVPIDPETIESRLVRAGLTDMTVDVRPSAIRVTGRR